MELTYAGGKRDSRTEFASLASCLYHLQELRTDWFPLKMINNPKEDNLSLAAISNYQAVLEKSKIFKGNSNI